MIRDNVGWSGWGLGGVEARRPPGKLSSHRVFYFIDNQALTSSYTLQDTHPRVLLTLNTYNQPCIPAGWIMRRPLGCSHIEMWQRSLPMSVLKVISIGVFFKPVFVFFVVNQNPIDNDSKYKFPHFSIFNNYQPSESGAPHTLLHEPLCKNYVLLFVYQLFSKGIHIQHL